MRRILFVVVVFFCGIVPHGVAFAAGDDGDLDAREIQALRDWLNLKRQVTVKEIGGNLSISGEVRAEFQKTNESRNGIKQRGIGSANPSFSTNAYDIEVNLMLDYRADRTWASFKLEFDNDAGLFTSTFNKIRIEKAFWGVRLVDAATTTFDLEIGRRNMSGMFDSKIEFISFFDGVYLRFDKSYLNRGDMYAHAGVFLVNDLLDQYAYVAELGWLSILDTGLYCKYSVIDWDTRDFSKQEKTRFSYIVNQWILGYKFIPKTLNKLVVAYSGFAWNPVAPKTAVTNHRKVNLGGYVGCSVGQLRKKGDWAIDLNYQVVQAQVVPEFDAGGIGLGNASKSGLYTQFSSGAGSPITSAGAAGGPNNFRGFMITLEYLLTNNLNLQQQWLQSITLDKSIGPFRRFKQYEIEFIYGF